MQRFGIPSTEFAGYRWWKTGRSYGVIRDTPYLEELNSISVQSIGLVALRDVKGYIKPTTQILHILGKSAQKNVLHLDRETLVLLLENRAVESFYTLKEGYVILAHQGDILGCGLALKHKLLHQFPRWLVTLLSKSFSNGQNRSEA